MKLSKYLTINKISQAKFAEMIGVHTPNLNAWLNNKLAIPIKYCLKIENITGGDVDRRELREDWALYWEAKKSTKDFENSMGVLP